MHSVGFPPVAGNDAKLLILGSLPGQASLRQQQYYAHPRNAFWHVMEAILNIPAKLPYAQRCQALADTGVALWDVCASAHRPGSMDGAIKPDSVVPNDIADFLRLHSRIQLICFNGNTAATLFRKNIRLNQKMPTQLLPSTSPAHAGMALAQKIEQWRVIQHAIR
jgi:hypoxanthine-DNA glycosylase